MKDSVQGHGHRQLKSRHPFVPAALELINEAEELNISTARWADYTWNEKWPASSSRLHAFIPNHQMTSPPRMHFPRSAWVRLNHLRTGVDLFHLNLQKCGLISSTTCECGVKEQTPYHVMASCPTYRHPNGVQGLKMVNKNLLTRLKNKCPTV